MIFRKLSNLRLGHFSENSQLRTLRHQVLGPDRERLRDLRGKRCQMLVHGYSGLTIGRAARVCGFFFAGRRGGRLDF